MSTSQSIFHPLEKRLLTQHHSQASIQAILQPGEEWHPYPTLKDRSAWDTLPEAVRSSHLHRGEDALDTAWPHLSATNYLNYVRNGNRREFEKPYFLRRDILGRLVLAECLENQGRFLDSAANAIWSICEEATWCVPAHVGRQKAGIGLPDLAEPIVDLFAAETAALLAWVDYLLGAGLDDVSPRIRETIRREVDRRVLSPVLERDDFSWMGFVSLPVNNWNPWINSNWLASNLLLEPDAERRSRAVWKILESLDCFVAPYPQDGGCDEGPGYWGRAGASLFDALELLHSATNGKFNAFDHPLVQEIGRFVYRAHIAGEYYVNFADAPARLTPDPMLVFRYGQRIGDPDMVSFGAWLTERKGILTRGVITEGDVAPSLGRVLPALFHLYELRDVQARPVLARDVWLPEIQVMAARDQAGTADGFYLAAKGGHNQESHNHNDVGHFIVYRDGKPVIIDVGVETYTRKTFSPQRYEIWTMQSAFHSLPSIGGVMQSPGRIFAARAVACRIEEQASTLTLDIARAYPGEAGLKQWVRSIQLRRGEGVEIQENWVTEAQVYQIAFHLITPCTLDYSIPGSVVLGEALLEEGRPSGTGTILYDSEKLSPVVEEIEVPDPRLQIAWGQRLARLTFRYENPPLQGQTVFRVTI